jgi:hypothetical protein
MEMRVAAMNPPASLLAQEKWGDFQFMPQFLVGELLLFTPGNSSVRPPSHRYHKDALRFRNIGELVI